MSARQIAPRQPSSGQRRRALRTSWALAPGTLRAAVVCFGVSGALLVAQAVMLALGFGGVMRHLLTLASWLFPDVWDLWGDVAGHIAVIVRVIGLAFGVVSLLGAAAWAVAVQCLHGRDAGR